MAASPMSFFLLLMAATFVVPFIVAIRMPNLRSLLTFALAIGAVQFTLATIAVQFADTALFKDEAQVFARFFLWAALGLGSAAGAVSGGYGLRAGRGASTCRRMCAQVANSCGTGQQARMTA